MATYAHRPVMLDEVLAGLDPAPDACLLDATFGRGGHARALLERLGPEGRLVALDRDPEAIAAARALAVTDRRVVVAECPFADLRAVVDAHDLRGRIDGLLMDLGVSSPQLDDPARGFSFQQDGPLDMRMSRDVGESARDWINRASVEDMRRVFRELGEERYARRIAEAIAAARAEAPIETTARLADVVSAAHPAWERGRHPATRVFLAIRLFVNSELEQVAEGLAAAVDVLAPGGRLAVISFHSLEDRIVKRYLRNQELGDPMLRKLPLPGGPPGARVRRIGGARRPTDAEVRANPRSRSATLRVAERLEEAA